MEHFLRRLQKTIRNDWEQPALGDFHGRMCTFAEVATEVARLHHIFRTLGVEPGDRVAIAARNSLNWTLSFLAITTYRAVAVPLLNDFTSEQIEGLVAHSESVLLFTESSHADHISRQAAPSLKGIMDIANFTAHSPEDKALAEAIAAAWQAVPTTISAEEREAATEYNIGGLDELIVINYTSGTTSQPKGVMLSARNISSNIEFALNTIPVQRGDSIVSMLPMAHMYGLAFEFLYPLCGGAQIYMLGKTPTPALLMQALAEVKPYLLITVPLVLEKIFKNRVIPKLKTPALRVATAIPGLRGVIYGKVRRQLLDTFGGRLRQIIAGGAAISLPVERVMKRVGLPYTVGYGMTECAPLIGYAGWKTFRMGSCGRAVPGVEVRIDSEDPRHKVGEIQVRGDVVMCGYYKNEEATRMVFTDDGFLRTGDLGVMDAEGNIFIRGRSKCMILSSSGQNIYPEEIEAQVNALEHIAESLVVERNKALVALVALTPDGQELTTEAQATLIEQHRRELNIHLPHYSQLSAIEIMPEGFEHTPKQSIKRFLYQ